ncbi:MAG TPA: hypothetical protein VIH25_06705 [Steroidobacteraceae bacterium]
MNYSKNSWMKGMPRGQQPVLAATAAAVLMLAAVIAITPGCKTISRLTGATEKADQRVAQLQELQLKVMRFADEYVGGVIEPVTMFQLETQDATERERAQSWKLSQATAAYTIASGPNPVTNALDLVVLATLSRMVLEDTWVQEKYGERAIPIRDAHRRLEPRAWSLVSEILTEAQVQQLHKVIDDWRERNPQVRAVSYVHFKDFAKSIGRPTAGESQSPGNLFSFLGLDPLSTLDPAVQEITQTRQLAERTIYYAQRTPTLLDMQIERLTYQLAAMPETRALLADVDRVSIAAQAAGNVATELPEFLAREREAAIRQFMQELAAQQQQMLALVTELKGALEAGTATSDSVQGTLRGIDALLGRFDKKGEEAPAPATPAKPFDIVDYANAAREFAATAKQLESLVVQLNAGAPQVGDLAERTVRDMRALVDLAFWRLVVLILVLIAGVLAATLAYRFVGRR